MKINIKSSIFLASIILIGSLTVAAIIGAATTLIPSGAPGATMKTLENIYQRITVGTAAIDHTLNPVLGPTTGTMHTLTDVYNAIPLNSKVCLGTNAGTAYCDPIEWSAQIGGSSDWATTKAYCENPTNGYTRLPTISELLKAVAQWRAIDGTGPEGFTADYQYWSETQYDGTTAWAVDSNSVNSVSASRPNKTDTNYGRCVR